MSNTGDRKHGRVRRSLLRRMPRLLARNEADKALLELVFSRQVIGRPFIAPPGLAPEITAMLRKAFEDKERSGQAKPLQFVVLDELNKYAPREGTSPIKEILLDVAERATGALILAFAKRRLDFKTMSDALEATTRLACFVMFILIGSRVFSLVFQGVDGGRWIEHMLSDLPGGQVGFLIFVNIFIFFLAFFLDFFEIAFIVIPLLAPVAGFLHAAIQVRPGSTPLSGYFLERLTLELWKSFVRVEDQSKYFIPMRFGIRGEPVQRVQETLLLPHMSIPFPLEDEDTSLAVERAMRMTPRHVLMLTERRIPRNPEAEARRICRVVDDCPHSAPDGAEPTSR